MYNYIAYRVYEYFELINGKNIGLFNTKAFLTILQISLLVTLFVIFEAFFHINPKEIIGNNENLIYYIAILIVVILYYFNVILLNKRFEGANFQMIRLKYNKSKYKIPIGLILLSPAFFLFGVPIIYGALNGTLRFE